MKKNITLILVTFLFTTQIIAQKKFDKLWTKVEQFEVDGLPKSARQIVEDIYIKAEKNNNNPQLIKSLLYKSKFALTLEEDAQLTIIDNFKNHIAKTTLPTKNILQNILANMYWQYFKQNRYRIYRRTKTENKVNASDFRTWDLNTLFEEIHFNFKESLRNEKNLQSINIHKFSKILQLQKTAKTYTPSLFDFLANNTLEFYKSSETTITRPSYKFIIDDSKFLEDAYNFSNLPVKSNDSLSLQLNALKIYQKLSDLHIEKNTNALANIDIERLNFVHKHATIHNKDSIFIQTLQKSKEKIKTHEASALYSFEIAKMYKNLNRNKEALAICNTVVKNFTESLGAKKCKILKKQIEHKTLAIQAEKNIPIDKHSRLFITYKNIDSLYFTAYKINQKQREKLDNTYSFKEKKAFIQTLTKTKTWQNQLRNQGDYLQHSTEIIAPKFNNGIYLIVATEAKSLDENSIYGTTFIQVTNLTLIENIYQGKYIYQVVHRNHGKPIKKAKIHIKNNSNHEDHYINKKLTTDENGFASFKSRGNYSNVNITIKTKKEVANFGNYYLYDYKRKVDKKEDEDIDIRPFIFTDRSIYRPGQTVYFKGIVVKKQGDTSAILTDKYVVVYLEDVNGQEIKKMELKLNEFGSIAGEFQLPNTGLTGEFSIYIDESEQHNISFYDDVYFNESSVDFAVEEYKRPKFKSEFKPITAVYKVNDSITVHGFSKAFSGANITDANVTYQVLRKVTYPKWFSWRRPNLNTSAQQITEGKTTTNEKGEFTIHFKAIPNETVAKKGLPIFTYEINADVTDLNGETRSVSTIVKVGYHALIASIDMDTTLDKSLQEINLNIDTKNLNDEFVPAKGKLKVFKLLAPKNPLRKRPWPAPDYQDIPENKFRILFPNDPYTNNETNVRNWKKGNLVFTSNFDTETSKEIQLHKYSNWASGKYVVVMESKDKFGQKVTTEKRFTLFSSKQAEVADSELFSIYSDKPNYKIGDTIALTVASASKDITVVLQIEKNFKIVDTKLISLNNEAKTIQIPVTKEDLGGFAIKHHFVNFNYFKSGNMIVNVSKKQESIAIETNIFRDKLQPGQDETWSFTIKNDKNNAVTAEVLAAMYDASLDEFKEHSWSFNPIPPKRRYYSYQKSNANKSFGTTRFSMRNLKRTYYNFPSIPKVSYNYFGFSFGNSKWTNRNYLQKISRKIRARNQKSTYKTYGNFTGTINGIVKDTDGIALPGVSILVKGSTIGTATDFDGKFSINTKKGNTLVISYLGFKTEEIKVKNFSYANIYLAEEYNNLDEVVVIGYGTSKRKSSVSAAVSSIESLQGTLPGVTAIQGSGTPGRNDMQIFVRGQASWNGTGNPLVIVDGVKSTIENIDFNDIENMTVLKDASATAIYGASGANGVMLISTKSGQEKIAQELLKVQTRKNFKETAFFYPQLRTDKNGKVSFSFTMPEALTRWKLELLAHTKELKYTSKTLQTITQKELMVTPNAPRFLREKDTITLRAKITNLTNNPLSGFAKLMLTDAISGKEIDSELQNANANKNFVVDKDGNTNVSWNLAIPENIKAIQYKIVAKAGDFSDGEQNVLPVLTNRMLVTETMPMWVRSNQTKTFTLNKLKNSTSSTLQNHKLTLEMTSNPVWYAIQSLPYLMEYPYECAEQTFSRYYANTLASFVANSNPNIQKVFNAWKSSDALLSNLEKNQELKSMIIQETPWLRDAQSETEQKKRIALLFDLNKMKDAQEKAIHKLQDIQMNSGGFPWFKGGRYPSTFITQHIATGFGHLQKLGVSSFEKSTQKMIEKAVKYLDNELLEQYERLLENAEKRKEKYKTEKKGEKTYKDYLAKNNLNYFTIQYLYMRSFYRDISLNDKTKVAVEYYQNQSIKYWNEYNLYAKGQIALTLFRDYKKAMASKILKSLKENAITSDELGMYWKENKAGYFYYQAPIETQALMIESFSEIENDTTTIDNLKIWLLKNKQTNSWKTTKATTEAVYALLLNGSEWISIDETVAVTIGNQQINPSKMEEVKVEAGTGYFKTSWNSEEIKPEMATVTINKKENGIAWGGLYWQYFEDLDKITSAKSPLKINKKLFVKVNSATGKTLKEINNKTQIKIGDLITVRIELYTDRDMEFIHLKDMRASGVEPTNVISKYKWQDNLGYYQSTKDASTNFFFDKLPKGVYVFEYDVRVNNAGNFSNGISTIQSMYAPEFSSHSEGIRINIEK